MVKVLPDPVTPEQRLEDLAVPHAFHQLLDRLRLVARRRIGLVKLERRIGKGDELAFFLLGFGFGDFWHGVGRWEGGRELKSGETGQRTA